MPLVAYILVITFVSIGCFWITGSIYGLFHRPSIYFPFSLAAKMAVCAVVGGLMLMVGGVILSTLVFNAEMKKREDYERWPTIIVGAIMSLLCTVIIYFSAFALAWEIFE